MLVVLGKCRVTIRMGGEEKARKRKKERIITGKTGAGVEMSLMPGGDLFFSLRFSFFPFLYRWSIMLDNYDLSKVKLVASDLDGTLICGKYNE
jgi:hypothetical protein